MKAIVVTKYGSPDVLQLKEVEKPVPEDNEVLIKIRAAAVNSTDPTFCKGDPFIARLFTGFFKPKFSIPGDTLSGEIAAIGKKVTLFKKGDAVYCYSTITMGAQAQYKCLPEDGAVALKPENASFEEAAGIIDGGLTALHFIRDKGEIKSGQRVLIYGASGSVGTAAVQLSKYFGAEVTGVCSKGNMEMVQSIGADKVLDYGVDDFTKSGETYDIIFDTVAKHSFSVCKKVLTANGIYLTTFPTVAIMLQSIVPTKGTGKRAGFAAAGMRPIKEKRNDFVFLKELMEAGNVKTVLDKTYSLEDSQEAYRYVEKGHKKGNVVMTIHHDD